MKKRMYTFLTGALALMVMAPVTSHAEADSKVRVEQGFYQQGGHSFAKPALFRDQGITLDQLMELVNTYSPELTEQFESLFNRGQDGEQHRLQRTERLELDDETKQKLERIRQQLKDGVLTEVEVREELGNLKLKVFKRSDSPKSAELDEEAKQRLEQTREKLDGLFQQLNQAIEENDETQIKDLLAKLLENLQHKSNQ